MSAPTLRDDGAVGPPEHLHPFFLLTGLSGSLRGIAGGYVAIGYLAVSGRWGTAFFGVLALVAIMTIGIFLHWRRFEYRVGASEIRIDSGIISRTHRSIPFDRIQDVDITQGPVARVLGLAKVKFETGASGGQEEGVLQAISLERAQDLRQLVRARRTGASAAIMQEADAIEPSPVYRMTPGRLLLAGTFNFSLALLAGLFGLMQTAGDIIGFNPFSRSFWLSVLSAGDPVRDFILAHRITTVAAGLLILLVLGAATGIVRTALTDFGFRVDRTGVGLRRRRGLFTKTDVTLPVSRAQAAVVASGPVKDWLKWREFRVQSLAKDEGSKQGSHLLAPLARDEEVNHLVEELGWQAIPSTVPWKRVSAEYVVSLALALTPLVLIAIGNVIFNPFIGVPFLAGLCGVLGVRWLAWRRTGYAVDGDRVLVRTGWWRRRITVLPARKIQSLDLRENFISRVLGIAWLQFGVAGGGMTGHSIPAIPRGEARKLRDTLLELGA